MPAQEILHEVEQLCGVSDRLNSLAEQNPKVSDGLATISRSVRNTATLLEVLIRIKIAPLPTDENFANT
jgi:hypothetical protein